MHSAVEEVRQLGLAVNKAVCQNFRLFSLRIPNRNLETCLCLKAFRLIVSLIIVGNAFEHCDLIKRRSPEDVWASLAKSCA